MTPKNVKYVEIKFKIYFLFFWVFSLENVVETIFATCAAQQLTIPA